MLILVLRAVFCVGTVFIVATLIVFRPPVSYFVLALFRYKLWLRARVHVGWLQQRLFQARTGLTANILRLPSPLPPPVDQKLHFMHTPTPANL